MIKNVLERRRRRRAERAIRRMSVLERNVYFAIQNENANYEEVAARLRIEPRQAQEAFANAVYRLTTNMRPRWWQVWLW